jgi:G3E family GTPase
MILMGGFLGAGKTSAMLALARWLGDQGIRAAFITNDQGTDLVDTTLLRSCGLTTEEIPGGCFCCRFDELAGATRRRGVLPPEVIVAEAVGSCTDLAATVTYPMRRLLGAECTVAPLSVLIDPVRGRRAFGLERGDQFSENVQYIFRKQLEEADLIVITKCDLLPPGEVEELRAVLVSQFPHAELFAVSSHAGDGTEAWFRRVLFHEQRPRAAMTIDYDRYADGESRLGWLNARGPILHPARGDGNALLASLAGHLHHALEQHAVAVAHLKMTLQANGSIAAVNLVRSDFVPEAGVRLPDQVAGGTLTVNLRAEAPPDLLERLVREAVDEMHPWSVRLEQLEAFRPGRPEPTHRDDRTALTPP